MSARAKTPRCVDAAPQAALKARLRARVRGSAIGKAALVAAATGLLAGCAGLLGPSVVYVPPGEPVRLRETVKHAPIWTVDAAGIPVAGWMDLPAGWYCLPDAQ